MSHIQLFAACNLFTHSIEPQVQLVRIDNGAPALVCEIGLCWFPRRGCIASVK